MATDSRPGSGDAGSSGAEAGAAGAREVGGRLWAAIAGVLVAVGLVAAVAASVWAGPSASEAGARLADASTVTAAALHLEPGPVRTVPCERAIGSGHRSTVRIGTVAVSDADRGAVLGTVESAFMEAGLDVFREERAPEMAASTDGDAGVLSGSTVTVIGGDLDGVRLTATATVGNDGTSTVAVSGRTECLR